MPCSENTSRHLPHIKPVDKPSSFQAYQYAFTAHIRDPKNVKRPKGVPAKGMKAYNELLYANIENLLLNCFPVLRKVLGQRKWMQLVRAFMADHRSHTPYFRQVPDEFMQFLQGGGLPDEDFPDYLVELAHYEWIELVLAVSNRDEEAPAFDASGDLIEGRPLLNPVLANLAYRYPVHRIKPRTKIAESPTCLLVFRDAAMKVHFIEQSPVSARLLALLESGELSGRQAVEQLAVETGNQNPARLLEFAKEFLGELRGAGAILGTRS